MCTYILDTCGEQHKNICTLLWMWIKKRITISICRLSDVGFVSYCIVHCDVILKFHLKSKHRMFTCDRWRPTWYFYFSELFNIFSVKYVQYYMFWPYDLFVSRFDGSRYTVVDFKYAYAHCANALILTIFSIDAEWNLLIRLLQIMGHLFRKSLTDNRQNVNWPNHNGNDIYSSEIHL